MKTTLIVVSILAVYLLAGCNGGQLVTVNFEEKQTLRYKFTCDRQILVNWDPNSTSQRSRSAKIDKYIERTEMVVSYEPIEVDPYGLTTIKATCESTNAERSSPSGMGRLTEPFEYFEGRSFTISIAPTGKIEDYSDMSKLMRQIAEKSFRPGSDKDRIKEPDMIGDFFATQWFLWDAVSSIEKPLKGLSESDTWQSKLSIPTPMLMRKARDVTYQLSEIRPSEAGQIAVIKSTYSGGGKAPVDWPMPYTTPFQMAGPFGFMRNYKVLNLEGEGEELFNLDAGRIEKKTQQYKAELEAGFPIITAIKSRLTIDQTIKMELLGTNTE